jgi:hypothetical protein
MTSDPRLGFIFHQPKDPISPGSPRLDVVIQETPSLHHFDPEKLVLNIITADESVSKVTLRHPFYALRNEIRVASGQLVMIDRIGKRVEAFSFGGKLLVESHETFTIFSLESPAPILYLDEMTTLQMRLVDEVKIIFAERRAAWLHDPSKFEKKLAQVEPLMLYASCLQKLEVTLKCYPCIGNDLVSRMISVVKQEMKRLKLEGVWPPFVKPIEDLL